MERIEYMHLLSIKRRAASMLSAMKQVEGLRSSGMLLCCPIPEQYAAEGQQVKYSATISLFVRPAKT